MPSEVTWKPKLLVLGDTILDRYEHCVYDRPSPEADLPILRLDKSELIPGGASAVACMAATLGAQVELGCPVYRGQFEFRLPDLIKRSGVKLLDRMVTHEESPPRYTLPTIKTRILLDGKPAFCRVDEEHIAKPLSFEVVTRIAFCDAVLCADYSKGSINAELMTSVAAECNRLGKPLLVDPARSRPWSAYTGSTLIKCNAAEWDAQPDAHRWAQWTEHLVVTESSNGMRLASRDGTREHFPSVATEVVDTCGAGDATLAGLGIALASGFTLPDACRYASEVAARCCGVLGARVA